MRHGNSPTERIGEANPSGEVLQGTCRIIRKAVYRLNGGCIQAMSTSPANPDQALAEEKTVPAPGPYAGLKGQPTAINCQSSKSLPYILQEAKCSFLVSTYLIGNVVTVGAKADEMHIDFHTFDRPMGMAVSREGIVICGRNQVWFMPMLLDIAQQMEPKGKYDLAYFVR